MTKSHRKTIWRRSNTQCQKYSITTNELQTLPELHGEMQSAIVNTHFYVPDQIQIVADHELPLIKQISQEEFKRLYEVKSKLTVPLQSFDVISLFHIDKASVRQSHQTYWHQIITTFICAVAFLGVKHLPLRSPLRNVGTHCLSPDTFHEPSTTAQNPSPPPAEKRRR